MTALANSADVQARLARTLTAAEVTRLAVLLDDASATIRGYTGQEFTETTTTVTLRVRNGKVLLPQRPVTAVSAIVDTAGVAVTFDWFLGETIAVPGSVLNAWEMEPRRSGLQVVDVTYTHGYATVPPAAVKVCCQIAARALEHPADTGGVVEESLGEYSYRLGSVSAAGGLLPEEKADLDGFRRVAGTVWAA